MTAATERSLTEGMENGNEKLTLAMAKERGISGADITREQYYDLNSEMCKKIVARHTAVDELRVLKDRYIKENNATGKSPDVAKFRSLRVYSSRENIERIHSCIETDKKDKLLALWDERALSMYEDEYTRCLDKLIEAAEAMYDDDMQFCMSIQATFKEETRRKEAEAKAKAERRRIWDNAYDLYINEGYDAMWDYLDERVKSVELSADDADVIAKEVTDAYYKSLRNEAAEKFEALEKAGVTEFTCQAYIKDRQFKPVIRHTAQGTIAYADKMYRKYGDDACVEVNYYDTDGHWHIHYVYGDPYSA